ncbi:MAG TPA: hypothetical protein VKT21_04360, partial [Thermoplasmata archaeon]|nr:hypothetical protein [Thermoplasmata archaeon]
MRTSLAVGLLLGVTLLGLTFGASPAGATPWSGPEPTPTNLLLYLHNSSTGVTVGSVSYLDVMSTVADNVTPWEKTGAISKALHYDAVSFVVAPQLAAPLTLNGTVNANVYMNESGSAPSGGTIVITVYSVSPTGTLTLLGTGPGNSATPLGPGGSVPKAITLPGPTLSQTVPAGDSIEVNITINGNTAEYYGIWWGNVAGTDYASTVSVPASTYLTVAQVQVLNSTGQPVISLSDTVTNQTVTVQGVLADPLGAYDFENFSIEFAITNATGGTVFGPIVMAPTPSLAPPGAANGTYQVSYNYSALAPGLYTFTV